MKLMRYALFLMSCVSCATVSVLPSDNGPEIITKTVRGQTYLIRGLDSVKVAINAQKVGNVVRFIVSIRNDGDKQVSFDENGIEYQVGDLDKNRWSNGKIFTASKYYQRTVNSNNINTAIMAFGAVANAISAGRSTSQQTGTFYGQNAEGAAIWGTYTGTVNTYDSGKASQEISQYSQNMTSAQQNGQDYLTFLRQNLLYSSDIPSQTTYSGFVFSEFQTGPNFRIRITIEGKAYSFVFFRSDIKEIRNPFMDSDRDKFALAYTYSTRVPFGLKFGQLNQDMGFWGDFGFSLPNFGGYPSEYENYSGNRVVNGVGNYVFRSDSTSLVLEPLFGVNYKVFPHLWIDFGLGLDVEEDYRLADHYYGVYSNPAQDYWDSRWISNQNWNFGPILHLGLTSAFGPIAVSAFYRNSDFGISSFGGSLGYVF